MSNKVNKNAKDLYLGTTEDGREKLIVGNDENILDIDEEKNADGLSIAAVADTNDDDKDRAPMRKKTVANKNNSASWHESVFKRSPQTSLDDNNMRGKNRRTNTSTVTSSISMDDYLDDTEVNSIVHPRRLHRQMSNVSTFVWDNDKTRNSSSRMIWESTTPTSRKFFQNTNMENRRPNNIHSQQQSSRKKYTESADATAGKNFESYNDPPNISIPSWSTEDRFNRAMVIPKKWKVLLGSSIMIGFLFCVVYLYPELQIQPTPLRLESSTTVISIFILMQIIVTCIAGIPDEDSSNEEINAKINASILIAMTLYPCFGLWMATRPEQLTFSNFWYVMGLDHLYTLKDEECDLFQWGYVFPFLFWSTSAIILIRDSNYAFTMDRRGVITDPDGTGKPMTALFRRNPSFLEVWSHRITSYLTFSLWSILPLRYRPADKAGRFAFQVIAPFVLIFFYVGGRFMLFALDMIVYMKQNPDDYTMVFKGLKEGRVSEDLSSEILRARFIVWLMFSFYCIFIRAFIGTKVFLRKAVPDPQSFKNRWVGWSSAIVESKRRRVLWAFRGLANAAVPYYVYWKYKNDAQSSANIMEAHPEGPTTFLDWAAYYLYLATFISFFFEGFGAFWFGLAEAQRGCNLHTPFKLFTDLSFWAAFNVYLQPLGTLTNIWFFITNHEYLMKLRLREIWGPLWLNEKNNFRVKLNFNKGILSKIFCKKTSSELPTQKELDARLDEWIETWRRKRIDAGRDTDNISIRNLESGAPSPIFTGSPTFRGTLFPTHDEWLYMRDHCEDYLSLLPWERVYAPEKFLRWYPSHREQIMSFLQEPYDFEVRREVWMFGYGSLISPESPPAGLTEDQKKQIIPYWLKEQAGYRRVWNYRHGPVSINAFGLEKVDNKDSGRAMNIAGCVYPMDYEKASDLFSYREEGYELLFVHEDYFEAMHPDFRLPKGIGYVWVCGQPTLKCKDPSSEKCNIMECKRHNPTIDSPILQSYIDTVLQGALRYSTTGRGHVDGMNFAAAILKSTAGWDYPWFNDRLLAGRPWTFLPQYELIDGLLSTCPTSRNAFIERCNAAMHGYAEKRPMLIKKKEETLPWGNQFFDQT